VAKYDEEDVGSYMMVLRKEKVLEIERRSITLHSAEN
jgi:hypothetical protein